MEKIQSRLTIELIDSFGHREYTEKDLPDDTIFEVIRSFRDALRGFGFDVDLINSCFAEDI